MTETEQRWLGYTALGVAVLGLFFVLFKNNAVITAAPGGGTVLNLPASDVTSPADYLPATFNLGNINVGGSNMSNPGSTVAFNTAPSGSGSPDATVAPCNCPGADTSSYGSASDFAAANLSFLNPLTQYLADQLPGVDTVDQYSVAQYGGKNLIDTALRQFKANNDAIKQAANNVWSSSLNG